MCRTRGFSNRCNTAAVPNTITAACRCSSTGTIGPNRPLPAVSHHRIRDEAAARRLWEVPASLTGVTFDVEAAARR